MRVLLVHRPGTSSLFGGDTVQLRETAAALRALGVGAEEAVGSQSAARYGEFDLVHFCNLEASGFLLKEIPKVRAAGRTAVLSPIYWDVSARRERAAFGWLHLEPRLRHLDRAPVRAAWRARERWRAGRRRAVLPLCHGLLPNSEGERLQLEALAGGALPPVEVVTLGIDPARFDPQVPRPLPAWARAAGLASRGYVLVAGRVEPWKNQLAAVEALQGSGLPVVLAGAAIRQGYAAACARAGALLVGLLEGEEMVAAYAHARVHLLPSYGETVGLVSLEAAAMGCAVVATSAGAGAEYLGATARYCDPDDKGSIRSQVVAAWEEGPPPGLSEAVRRERTWAGVGRATLAAYERLLGASR